VVVSISDDVLEKLRAKLPSAGLDESLMHELVRIFIAAGAGPTLAALCDGNVSMARLDALAPRHVWERMVALINLWTNAFAGGSEIIVISSPPMPSEEGGIRFKELVAMALTLEAAGVLRIETVEAGKKMQFRFTLVDAPEDAHATSHHTAAAPVANPDFPVVMAQAGPRFPVSVCFIGNGRALSGARDGTMTLWDLHAGRALHTYLGHTESIWSIACSVDGTRAVTASGDCTMRLWHVETGQCLRVFGGHDDPLRSVELLQDGRQAVTGGWNNTMRVWDLDSGRCLRRYECNAGSRFSHRLPVSMAANRALSNAPGGQQAIWDLHTGACMVLLKFNPYPGILAFSEDGCFVLGHHIADVGDEKVGRLYLWDLPALTLALAFAPFPGQKNGYARPDCVALSPCGRYVAAGYDNGHIHVWDRADGSWLRVLDRHARGITGLHFSIEGLFLLSAAEDMTIRLWEVDTGKCLRLLGAPAKNAAPVFAGLPGVDLAQPLHPAAHNDDVPLSDLSDAQKLGALPVVVLSVPVPVV
jgi:WD40 repeat protein